MRVGHLLIAAAAEGEFTRISVVLIRLEKPG